MSKRKNYVLKEFLRAVIIGGAFIAAGLISQISFLPILGVAIGAVCLSLVLSFFGPKSSERLNSSRVQDTDK